MKIGARARGATCLRRRYEALGVDAFIYYVSMGMGLKEQGRSLEFFCSNAIPAFA